MKAFGTQKKEEIATYSLLVNSAKVKEIDIKVSNTEYTILRMAEVREQLRSLYKSKYIELISKAQKITLSELKSLGFNSVLDDSSLSISFIPKPEQKLATKQSFQNESYINTNTLEQVSGYINHYYEVKNLTEVNYFGDFAFNKGYWTLEGNHQLNSDYNFEIESLKLIRDYRSRLLRFEIGDITHGDQGFVGAHQGVGLTLSKNNTLNPLMKTRITNKQTFFLKKSAWVNIFINKNIFLKKYYLAGEHSIEGFNLPRGISEIDLEIVYTGGESETRTITISFDYSLLKQGFLDYQVSLLSNQQTLRSSYEKLLKQPKALSRMDYGFTKNVTLGLSNSIEENLVATELRSVISSNIGNFSISQAYSYADRYLRMANRVSWFYQNHASYKYGITGFNLDLSHLQEGFSKSYSAGLMNEEELNFNFSTQFSFRKNWNLDLSYSRSWKRNSGSRKIQMRLLKQWNSKLRTNLEFNHIAYQNEKEQSLFFRLQYTPKNYPASLTSQIESSGRLNLNASIEKNKKSSSYRTNISLNKYKNEGNIGLSSTYSHQFFNIGTSIDYKQTNKKIQNEVNFSHSTAFVGKQVALSKPIFGSFSIFKLKDFKKKRSFRINSDGEIGYQAKIGSIPTAIGNMTAYTNNYFEVDNFDINPGEEITNKSSIIVPRYKSGNIIELERKSNFFVTASLSYLEKPLSYVVVDVIDDLNKVVTQSFTDSDGQVLFQGLSNGQYTLDFGDYAPKYKIIIKGDQNEVFNLGHINLN